MESGTLGRVYVAGLESILEPGAKEIPWYKDGM